METPANFTENGNYRVATVEKVKNDRTVVVKCHFDDLVLGILPDQRHFKRPEEVTVGDLCYVYRTTLDACILIDFAKQ